MSFATHKRAACCFGITGSFAPGWRESGRPKPKSHVVLAHLSDVKPVSELAITTGGVVT